MKINALNLFFRVKGLHYKNALKKFEFKARTQFHYLHITLLHIKPPCPLHMYFTTFLPGYNWLTSCHSYRYPLPVFNFLSKADTFKLGSSKIVSPKNGRIVEEGHSALGIYRNGVYALYTFIWRHWLQYWF